MNEDTQLHIFVVFILFFLFSLDNKVVRILIVLLSSRWLFLIKSSALSVLLRHMLHILVEAKLCILCTLTLPADRLIKRIILCLLPHGLPVLSIALNAVGLR